jgi:hypothetical protein
MTTEPKAIAPWRPTDSDWPDCYEAVDLFWAKLALDWAHAGTLARYLRETPAADIDELVLRRMRRMLDPAANQPVPWRLKLRWSRRGRPTAARPSWPIYACDLADMLDPRGDRGWQLIFERRSPGNPGRWDQYQRQHALATDIKFTRLNEQKLSWAVEYTRDGRKRAVSRATGYRALRGRGASKIRNS